MQNHRISYTCQLCQSKTFQLRERYLAHVRKKHPNILEDGDEQLVLDIARKPLNQICAQECPCCSEWVNRLKEREVVASRHSGVSEHIIYVDPTVFKRHLASHLEQLALFAILIGSGEDHVNSNAAIDEGVSAPSGLSGLSELTFDSSRPSSLASKWQSSNEILTTEGVVEAAEGNEENEREETTLLLDQREAGIPIMEKVVDASPGRKLGEGIQVARKALNATTNDHPDLPGRLTKLGLLLKDQGKYEEAETMHRQALELREKVLGPEHFDTLTSVSNLGLVLMIQGKHEVAEVMHQRVLEGRKKALGSDHPDTLSSVHNLGSLYQRSGEHDKAVMQGKPVQAVDLFLRALQIYERTLGPEHTSTLDMVSNIGYLFKSYGKLVDAEEMYQRALQGYEKVLGPEYTTTLNTLDNLGALYKSQGKLNQAEEMYQRILQGYEKVFGPEHPLTLNKLNELGRFYESQGKLNQAEEMYQRMCASKMQ